MTRIAFLSDIHGNWDAFDTILNDPKFIECDLKIFCGDAVGYYYDGAKVLAHIHKVFDSAILGNHDREMLSRLGGKSAESTYERKYGSGLNRSMAALDANDVQWFSSLKDRAEITINTHRIGVYHEAPVKGNEYVYPDCDENVKINLFSTEYDLLVLGHSHYQYTFEKNGRYVLNPGSVGQSRKHGGYADWASVGLNENNIDIRFHSEKYSIGNLIQQVEKFDPDIGYLKEVLTRIG